MDFDFVGEQGHACGVGVNTGAEWVGSKWHVWIKEVSSCSGIGNTHRRGQTFSIHPVTMRVLCVLRVLRVLCVLYVILHKKEHPPRRRCGAEYFTSEGDAALLFSVVECFGSARIRLLAADGERLVDSASKAPVLEHDLVLGCATPLVFCSVGVKCKVRAVCVLLSGCVVHVPFAFS
jgi:hypothetical protein